MQLKGDGSTCPSGYKRCGAGNYTNGAMCQLTADPCPVTWVGVSTDGSAAPAGYSQMAMGDGTDLRWFRPASGATVVSGRAAVDLTNGFGTVNEKLCFGETLGRNFAGRSGETSGFSLDGGCSSSNDPRYLSLDTITMEDYVTRNFNDDPECVGC